MAGTLTIPNVFSAQSGDVPVSELDDDFSAIASYVNAREIAQGLLISRPAAGVSGRYYFATDVQGGTLYLDSGVSWSAIAPGVDPILTAGPPVLLSEYNASGLVTVGNTTTETTVCSLLIEGGTLGTTRCLRLRMHCTQKQTVLTRTLTFNLKYGGSTVASFVTTRWNSTPDSFTIDWFLRALGTTNSQLATANLGLQGQGGDFFDGIAVDSSVDQTLAVTAQQDAAELGTELIVYGRLLTVAQDEF